MKNKHGIGMAAKAAVLLAMGSLQAFGYINEANVNTTQTWAPPLPPPGSGSNYSSSKAACSGNSIETVTTTPNCPACYFTSEFWGPIFCDCPPATSTQQTFTFSWNDTSTQGTVTISAGASLPAGDVANGAPTVNADGTLTYSVTIESGTCTTVAIGQ
jgi:hypothetical protein